MKKIYTLIFVVAFFVCKPQDMFADDTLFVVTNKGNYFLDVATQMLIPYSEDNSKTIIFSTEGLDYFIQSPSHSLEYSYKKEEDFIWWDIQISDSLEKRQLVNFDTKPPGSGYIMYPLSWNSNFSSLYFFSTNGDALDNEKGIYEYNIQTKKFSLRIAPSAYNKIPLVNKAKTTLYFLRTDLRGQSIISYNMETHIEKIIFSGLDIFRLGIIDHSVLPNSLPVCAIDLNQPTMKSPFKPLISFCVTRMGFDNILYCDQACDYASSLCSTAPYCEGHCEAGCINCRDAVDMDVVVSNYSNKVLRASAEGYAIRVQTICPISGMGQGYGFGHHIIIRHGDLNDTNAPETLYAHMDSIFIEEGQFIFAGQQIGELGNSQALDCDSDGILDCDCDSDINEHLHYEYHAGNGNMYSVSDIYAPVFVDIGGCVPQPNNSYTTNFEGVDSDAVYPSSNTSLGSVEVNCATGLASVTLVGERCDCCVSWWGDAYNNEYPGDTLVVVVTDEMTTIPELPIYRTVESPCLSWTSYSDGPSFLVLDDYFSSCVPGCTDMNACNYEAWATYHNGSCEYLCASECEIIDIDQDGIITTSDVLNFLGLVGSTNSEADFNQDGQVGVSDLVIMFSFFGEICD